jgi:hypothetical protein
MKYRQSLFGQVKSAFRKKAFAAGGGGYYFQPLDLKRLNILLENFLFSVKKKAPI